MFLIKVPGKQSLFYILLWKRHALPSNKRIESSRRTIRLVAPNLTDEIYLAFVYILKKISNIRLFFRYYVSWLEILVILTFGFPNYISETYSRFFVFVVESVFWKGFTSWKQHNAIESFTISFAVENTSLGFDITVCFVRPCVRLFFRPSIHLPVVEASCLFVLISK